VGIVGLISVVEEVSVMLVTNRVTELQALVSLTVCIWPSATMLIHAFELICVGCPIIIAQNLKYS
jgi:hypothetical protein